MSDDNDHGSEGAGGRSLGGGSNEPLPSSWARPAEAPRVGRIGDWSGASGSSRGGSSGSGSSERFGTIGGLSSNTPPSRGPRGPAPSADDNKDPDKRETWFAGGEKSGLSIQNPEAAQNVPGGNLVRDLLRRAAEGGPAPEAGVSRLGAFAGGGHTLGSEDVPSSFIPDPNASSEDELPTAIRTITFWRDGFTIEDGELLRYDDPNNDQLLSQINSGHAPLSVLNIAPNQRVELRVAKRTNEEYIAPKGAKTFSGSGNRLGAPVPNLTTEAQANAYADAMPGSFSATASATPAAAPPRASISTRFEVDQNLPTTSVQVRLADGTRMVCRMNLTHTVLDLRNFINASRPENLTRSYTIGTTFPNRTLEDDTATIEAAGLQNSVIVQRWV